MRRRGRGRGNIFGDSGAEESLPEFDVFIHLPAGRRAPAAKRYRTRRAMRPGSGGFVRRAAARPVRPLVLGTRLAICSLLLVFGLLGMAVETVHAVRGYSDAGRLASAPSCASEDPSRSTRGCTVTTELTAPYGTFDDGGEESIELDYPDSSADSPDFNAFVSFPGDARFDAAVGDGSTPAVVRVEYWNGQIVTLTAGKRGVTVTADQNPNNVGGAGVGGALMSLAFVLAALLMFVGIRSIRLRWLRQGFGLRLFVSGSLVLALGAFVAGGCLINQPARVLLVAAIAPPVTVGLAGLLWLGLWSSERRRALPASSLH